MDGYTSNWSESVYKRVGWTWRDRVPTRHPQSHIMKSAAVVVCVLLSVTVHHVVAEADALLNVPQGGVKSSIPGGFLYSFNTVHPTTQSVGTIDEGVKAAEKLAPAALAKPLQPLQPWTNSLRLYNGYNNLNLNSYYNNLKYNNLDYNNLNYNYNHPAYYGHSGYLPGHYNAAAAAAGLVGRAGYLPNQLQRYLPSQSGYLASYPSYMAGYPSYYAGQSGYMAGHPGYLAGQPGYLASQLNYQTYLDGLVAPKMTEDASEE